MKSRRGTHQLSLFDHSAPDPYSREPAGREAGREPVVRDPQRAETSPRLARSDEATEPLPGPVARGTGAPRVEDVRRLASELKGLVGTPVRLLVHDNRSTMVSFRREESMLHLRVHHMFLGAQADVVKALAEYARARSAPAGRRLDQFVRENRERIKPLDVEQARQKPLRTRGSAHDLDEIFASLNRRYFEGTIDARIGWGRGTTGRRRRSIRMGAYYHDTRTILIHPALDRPEVPRYFVELVVYHEMLHQAVPQQRSEGGRRCIHSAEFRRRERLFAEFDRARSWERRHLPLLLRPVRSARERTADRDD